MNREIETGQRCGNEDTTVQIAPSAEHQQWMAQWRGAAKALQEQKEIDLSTMTLSDAQIATMDLLSFPVKMIDRDSPRWSYSGLVKQQEYFMKTSDLYE